MTSSRLLEDRDAGSARTRLAMSWPPGSSHYDISRLLEFLAKEIDNLLFLIGRE
jgi:hypothetical protein